MKGFLIPIGIFNFPTLAAKLLICITNYNQHIYFENLYQFAIKFIDVETPKKQCYLKIN